MLNENAKKWVAALRSGRFTQTKNKLTRIDGDNRITGCCCMGVACELAVEAGVQVSVTDDGFLRIYDHKTTSLPQAVIKWLGVTDQDGGYFRPSGDKYCLVGNNDNGKTFSEIADIIESEPEGLFV